MTSDENTLITAGAHEFLETQRVARLATADAHGAPHVVPVCFALSGDTIYITIDDKPKRSPTRSLKRLRNIAENPKVALLADHYDDGDWSRLGWIMLRGRAEVIHDGPEHAEAQRLLKARYAQLATMALERHPVIAIRVEHATSWGDLRTNRTYETQPNAAQIQNKG